MTALHKEKESEDEAPINAKTTAEGGKLKQLLKELHDENPKKTAPSHNAKQRAEDILNLIRQRQKKRGEDNE
jgi:hypothetical protein